MSNHYPFEDKETITRDDARNYFYGLGFDYDDVNENDIYALEAFMGLELAEFNEGHPICMHVSHRTKDAPTIKLRNEPGEPIRAAFLRVDGSYFMGREAISFNGDGFIGFAGWADDVHIQPFLRAFVRWTFEWIDAK